MLSAMNRADLLHDAFLLAETDLNYSIAMNLTSYLINEDDYQPWVVAMRWFGQMNRLLDRTHILPRFQVIQVLENYNCHSISSSSSLLYSFYTNSQSYARNLINRIYRQIGWHIHRKDSFKDRLVQNYVIRKICIILIEICKTTLVIVNKIMFFILVNPILKF